MRSKLTLLILGAVVICSVLFADTTISSMSMMDISNVEANPDHEHGRWQSALRSVEKTAETEIPGTLPVDLPTNNPSIDFVSRFQEVDAVQDPLLSEIYTAAKDVTVYITRTGKKYHRGNCRYLARSKFPISKSDAIASGYGPCKVCKP